MAKDLYTVIADALMIDKSEVNDDLRYNSRKEWDSTAHMALIVELEENYEIMLDTDDIVDMSSVGKIRDILKKYDVEA